MDFFPAPTPAELEQFYRRSGYQVDVTLPALMTRNRDEFGCAPPVRVVLRGSVPGWTSFDDTLTASPVLVDHVDVDAPALVGWTSGTTSGAKGVAHSTRSFVASPLRTSRWLGSRWDDRSYMPAPIAHATGLLSCIAVPLFTGSSTVIRDGWDADRAIDDIASYGVTTSAGAAGVMAGLLAALEGRGQHELPLRSGYPGGGSTIPTQLAERCDDAGMLPAGSWGRTARSR